MTTNIHTPEHKKANKNLILAFSLLIVAIIIVIILGFFMLRPRYEIIQGQAEADETRISGKLTGRIAKIYVQRGDNVQVGDTLVTISSEEVEAKLLQVEAQRMAAQAQNQKADVGTRPQIIQSAYEMWQKANAGF